MSTLVYGSLLGALLLLLAGCYGNTPPVVKLGLIAPFEELYRDDGYAALHAVRLAVKQRNAAGGVAGRQVALVALNDNGRPTDARQQAAALGVDGNVLGVIGPLQSATAQAAGPALAAQGLPWLALASLTAEQQPGGFALEAPPDAVAGRAAELPAQFVADYRALAGSNPSPQAVLAYDAANLLLDALDRAGQQDAALTRPAVRQALIDLEAAGWQGLTGSVTWREAACPTDQPCWPRLDPPLILHR